MNIIKEKTKYNITLPDNSNIDVSEEWLKNLYKELQSYFLNKVEDTEDLDYDKSKKVLEKSIKEAEENHRRYREQFPWGRRLYPWDDVIGLNSADEYYAKRGMD